MKTTKILTCGASVLFAAVLGLHAQSATPSDQRPSPTSPSPSSSPSVTSSSSEDWRKKDTDKTKKDWDRSSTTSSSVLGSQASTGSTTTVGVQSDVEVKTVVQQIDAQGPVVVERISTRFADVACTEENARKIVEALHNGGSLTITGQDGKTATFDVNTKLGYGDAYIAMALAAEALRNAGISGCATPEQWQAVLVGGELKGSGIASTTTTVTTERFPGILVLREQHGGWGQVAQTTNVQLGTVVASAHSSLNIDSPTSDLPPRSGFGDEADKNSKASDRGQEKGKMKGYDADKKNDASKKHDPYDPYAPRSSMPGSDTEDPSGKRQEKKGQPDQPPRGY